MPAAKMILNTTSFLLTSLACALVSVIAVQGQNTPGKVEDKPTVAKHADDEASPAAALVDAMKASPWNPEIVKALAGTVRRQGSTASATLIHDEVYYSGYTKLLSEAVREPMRSSVVRMGAISQLTKLPALELDEIDSVLKKYSYPHLLKDYARGRLIKKVNAELVGVGERVFQADHGLVAVCLVSLPRGSIKLKTVEIVSDRDALVFYHVALFKETGSLIDEKKFPEAIRMLMEARRHGNDGITLFKYLYTCYLLSGNAKDTQRVRELLVSRFGADLSFEDHVEFAKLAESSPLVEEADHWYRQAETRVRKSLSLDMLMNQP